MTIVYVIEAHLLFSLTGSRFAVAAAVTRVTACAARVVVVVVGRGTIVVVVVTAAGGAVGVASASGLRPVRDVGHSTGIEPR